MAEHRTWPFLSTTLAALAAAAMLAGCNATNCAQSICGCWEDFTVSLEMTVVDQFGDGVDGVRAICVNEDAPVATTNGDGELMQTFDTRVSPGCGTERCNTLTLLDPEGRCEGTQSTLAALNFSTVTLTCTELGDDDDDDDDSAR
ncbi:MAG: hypothetical protein KDA24_09145 [Deltaproteobacteria bacterium]|nr:hypothetical protein [Deltaproteobacteria bacterium]